MKKGILIVLTILVVGFVGYQWYSSKKSTQSATAQVRTAVVQNGTFEVKISGSGTVQVVTSEDIKSKIDNNQIDEPLVTVGETVNEGDELITFTDGSDPITAPSTGIVTTLTVGAGERVTNGQVVAHLTNYQNLQTVVQIDELDIPKMKIGQTVSLQVNAYPDQAYTGSVTMVAEEGVAANGVSTFEVTIHIDKPDTLKVGMSVEASILSASKENALFVPVDAIYTANDQKFVIATSASTDKQTAGTEQKTVKTGLANEDYVEITEGISAGETIQLPQLAAGSTATSRQGMQQSGDFGGMGQTGGMNRTGGIPGQAGGRSGN
jgi:multidrug efflux pump subunit AcrA (membrane-fusion protein)